MGDCGLDSYGWISRTIYCELGYELGVQWKAKIVTPWTAVILAKRIIFNGFSSIRHIRIYHHTLLDNIFHITLCKLSLITGRRKQVCHWITLFSVKNYLENKSLFLQYVKYFHAHITDIATVVSSGRRQQKWRYGLNDLHRQCLDIKRHEYWPISDRFITAVRADTCWC